MKGQGQVQRQGAGVEEGVEAGAGAEVGAGVEAGVEPGQGMMGVPISES